MSTPEAPPEIAAPLNTLAQTSPAGSFYKHIDSQQVTEFVPPNSSKRVWQIRGLEPNSGVVFLSLVTDKQFHTAGYVKTHMGQIGHIIYTESLVAGVTGISVRQVIDSQNQLKNELDVTVQSASGNSEGRITVPYPHVADPAGSVATFTALVVAEAKLLDANEAS